MTKKANNMRPISPRIPVNRKTIGDPMTTETHWSWYRSGSDEECDGYSSDVAAYRNRFN